MPSLMQLIEQFGLLLVFVNVFVEQLGAPVPAVPTMLVAGALAANGAYPLPLALAVTTSACVLADSAWFALGRHAGWRALRSLCRFSSSPGECLQRTERRLRRLGPKAIVFAKFVPGFGLVTTTMAGTLGVGVLRFLALDTVAAVLWTGLNLSIGWWLHDSVASVVASLERTGWWGVAAVAGVLSLWILARVARIRRSSGLRQIGPRPETGPP